MAGRSGIKMQVTQCGKEEWGGLNRVTRVLNKVGTFGKWINVIGVFVLFLVTGLVAVDVVMRYFDYPIKGVTEIVEVLMIAAVFLGLAHTYNEKGNISMDLITPRLSTKVRLVWEFITTVISLALFVVVTWRVLLQTISWTEEGIHHGYTSIPVAPFASLVVLGCILLTLLILRDILQYISTGMKLKLSWFQWLLMAVIPVVFMGLAYFWMQPDLWEISLITVALIGIVFSLALMMTGMPIAFVLILTSFIFISHIRGSPTSLDILGTNLYRTTGNFLWAVVSFFVLMGYFCLHAGYGKDLYYTAYKWIGHWRGGLAIATVAACTGFAAIVGDTLSCVVTFGSISLPEMKKYKYDDKLSTASVIAGASLGPLIPPSMGAIVYGLLTSVSIGKLFIAILIPGVIMALSFIGLIIFWCRRNPVLGPAGERSTWKPRLVSLRSIAPVLILAFACVGGIYTGAFSPSEGGAIGAFVAVIVGLVMRRWGWKNFTEALLSSAKVISMFFLLIIGAVMFSQFMAWCHVSQEATNLLNNIGLPHLAVEGLIILVLFVLGFVMDGGALLLIAVPIIYPITTAMGADPIWFAVCVLIATDLGSITPPYALNIFALKGIAKEIPIGVMYTGIMPFVLASMVALVIVFFVPVLSTWLPNLLK
jgi:tripartite ATP-independent transporter DctM subunit